MTYLIFLMVFMLECAPAQGGDTVEVESEETVADQLQELIEQKADEVNSEEAKGLIEEHMKKEEPVPPAEVPLDPASVEPTEDPPTLPTETLEKAPASEEKPAKSPKEPAGPKDE